MSLSNHKYFKVTLKCFDECIEMSMAPAVVD